MFVIPKNFFFDREKVIAAVGKARASVMAKAGAYIRRTAQFSIRTRKSVSKPGQPPTNRTGLLREFIFFSFDPTTRTVVIGPAKAKARGYNVPNVLEFGGTFQIPEVQLSGGLWTDDKRYVVNANGRPTRKRLVNIAARPYMGPALAKNRDKIAAFWTNALAEVRA